MKTIKLLSILFISSILLQSCSNDDDTPEEVNEEELITTLIATLRDASTGSSVTLTFRDLDGDGGDDPVVTPGTLAANTTYNGTIQVLNETETPAEDITLEVLEEDDEHQFLYVIGGGLNATTEYTDADGDGNPIGVTFNLTTGDASSGTLTFILRHEPTKPNDGTPASAGGETDISAPIPVNVQ
ncbi:type 1 periplasmic binding fold superfamily protein [Patiriisocius hiemis]|uniref:Type 1 periplasmic binding fold superfamily protein n=1 Tax=Patiriisocius hiemis TaxID=3075604 RepID=A0ABU2Y9Q3_9FLAO|nr:type 1 periplasmic binding fold superfamily protein [Constantimarinum sp. W242]MDT0554917.1 type 1 periplasmic binding fold superfamily protein [Constantimarinum sp. W242]